MDLAALLTRALVDYPLAVPDAEGYGGETASASEEFGVHLYTRRAHEELLQLFHREVLASAPPGSNAPSEFTMERLREEYAIGCIAWYEIQVGAGVTVLADPSLVSERFPLDTGCLPLNYSSSPGVNGVSHRGNARGRGGRSSRFSGT
jgi:hypothetical protein